jgi:ADP-heptose:LPS heptosyltransferase
MSSVRSFGRPTVLLIGRLSDQIIALPALRGLAALFPEGIQLILGEGLFSCFYRGLPVGEDCLRAHWRDRSESVIDVDRIRKRAAPCDLFLSLSTAASGSIADLAARLGAGRTIGLDGAFAEHVPHDESMHMFDVLFSIPQRLEPSLRIDAFLDRPRFSNAAEAAAAKIARTYISRGQKLLFVHPETRDHKRWPPERFSLVLRRFLELQPEYRAVISSVAPFPMDLGAAKTRAIHLDLHLELAMALLGHADLFLGVDSCFLHAADMFRIPGVALFGPTDPANRGFRFSGPFADLRLGPSLDAIPAELVLSRLLELARNGAAEQPERPRARACSGV